MIMSYKGIAYHWIVSTFWQLVLVNILYYDKFYSHSQSQLMDVGMTLYVTIN
jgi:hypothetical protein